LDGGSTRRKAATYKQNNTNRDIHASSVFRAHDPSVRADEDSSYPRPRGHWDRRRFLYVQIKFSWHKENKQNRIYSL
jgi:hypothetical protein